MAVPDFQTLMLPLLRLAGDGKEHSTADAVEQLGKEFRLSVADLSEPLKSGQTRFYNRDWARTYLVKAGLLQKVGLGRFEVPSEDGAYWPTRRRSLMSAICRCTSPKLLRQFGLVSDTATLCGG